MFHKGGTVCVHRACSSKTGGGISLFTFPKERSRAELWLKACNREDLLDKTVDELSKNYRLCEKHFEEKYISKGGGTRKHLFGQAVPTIFPLLMKRSASENSTSKGPVKKMVIISDVKSTEHRTEATKLSSCFSSSFDADPLDITTTDGLSLFGDSAGNIEFVIESDEADEQGEEVEESHIVINLSESDEDPYIADYLSKQSVASSTQYEENLSLPNIEEIKEEIDIDEEGLQIPAGDEAEINLLRQSRNVVQENETNVSGRKLNTRCYVPDCTIAEKEGEPIYWFKAPKDQNLRKIWDTSIDHPVKRLGSDDVFCHQHFSESDIILKVDNKSEIGLKPCLRQGAVPCIMFHEKCCVPGCDTASGRMFTFPMPQTSNFDLWLYLIKNPDLKKFKIGDLMRHRVCKLHFEPECFENDFSLKTTAAPTLFLPVYINPFDTKPIVQNPIIKPKKHLTCTYGDCKNTSSSGKVLFNFPWNPKKCIAWLKACRKEGLISTPEETVERMATSQLAVCELHFDHSDFLNSKLLKCNAVPIVCTDGAIRKSIAFSDRDCQPSSNNSEEKDMATYGDVCSYRNCNNKESKDNPFFMFPSDEELLEKWLRACQLNIISSSKYNIFRKNKICSKHFDSDMFASKNKLKLGAIPKPYRKEGKNNIETQNEQSVRCNVQSSNNISCAIRTCANTYGLLHGKGKFPNPSEDNERFNIWLKLVGNPALRGKTPQDIYNNFMVCLSHFEPYFFMNDGIVGDLHEDAVPTKFLTADMKWLYTSDYFKNRLQKHKSIFKQETEATEVVNEKIKESLNTTCILEEEGIRFPATGHFLYMEKRPNLKRKFPYEVYKLCKSGYELNDDLAVGENIKIHTAIIIDDDDEVERQVLRQLLNKNRIY